MRGRSSVDDPVLCYPTWMATADRAELILAVQRALEETEREYAQMPLVVRRHAPLLVMVREIERILGRYPVAAGSRY